MNFAPEEDRLTPQQLSMQIIQIGMQRIADGESPWAVRAELMPEIKRVLNGEKPDPRYAILTWYANLD